MNFHQSVLVFPIDMPQSVAFARTAQQLGFSVVVASSEHIDPALHPESKVAHLPYVTDREFDDALAVLLKLEQISLVYAPHPAIWWHLESLRQRGDFPVDFRVCNESPYEMDWHSYGVAYRWAEACISAKRLVKAETTSTLSSANYAGLYRFYNQIPGQSDDTKLFALAQIARTALPGDVVEIGSLYGKSAFALAWLAKFHHIGTVICVDSWEMAFVKNQGDQAGLVNAAAVNREWQQAFLGFAASLAVFDHVNYLRAPSELAAETYQRSATVGSIRSDEFGCTPVSGKISMLHIDGNHKYEAVKRDIEKWLPFVQDGGWLLLDDYVWAFGDGPKRAGDEFLEQHVVKTSFVVGDTLFIQV